ncbi:MAG: HTH domain-containing protein [Bacteroidales bacterium]|nr:HTH domain-containing protein [Bacteroidales bacterium]
MDEDGQVIIWRKNVTPDVTPDVTSGKGTLRVKNILTELMSNRYITTDELAAKFKVSSRTITRDINSLRETYTIIWIPLSNTKGYWKVEHK